MLPIVYLGFIRALFRDVPAATLSEDTLLPHYSDPVLTKRTAVPLARFTPKGGIPPDWVMTKIFYV